MARLAMRGYESQDTAGANQWVAEAGFGAAVVPTVTGTTFDTVNARQGKGTCLKIDTAGKADQLRWVGGLASGGFQWARAYFMTTSVDVSATSSGLQIMELRLASSATRCGVAIAIGTTGCFELWHNGNPIWGPGGNFTPNRRGRVPIQVGRWYCLEIGYQSVTTAGSLAGMCLRIDGSAMIVNPAAPTNPLYTADAAIFAGALDTVYLGDRGDTFFGGVTSGLATGAIMYYDDVAANDESGAAQNTWPGEGKVTILTPISDNARGTNWLNGAAGTTSLFDAVNNEPPIGASAGTAGSRVQNSAKDTTGNYDANLQTYTTGGVGSDDTVVVAQAVALLAQSSTTASMGLGIQTSSNPVIAETTATAPTVAAGTHPTNWVPVRTVPSYSPTITKGSSPVARLRKTLSSTTGIYCEFMGLMIDYAPPPTRPPRVYTISQAVMRAAVWMKRHLRQRPWLAGPRVAWHLVRH